MGSASAVATPCARSRPPLHPAASQASAILDGRFGLGPQDFDTQVCGGGGGWGSWWRWAQAVGICACNLFRLWALC